MPIAEPFKWEGERRATKDGNVASNTLKATKNKNNQKMLSGKESGEK